MPHFSETFSLPPLPFFPLSLSVVLAGWISRCSPNPADLLAQVLGQLNNWVPTKHVCADRNIDPAFSFLLKEPVILDKVSGQFWWGSKFKC